MSFGLFICFCRTYFFMISDKNGGFQRRHSEEVKMEDKYDCQPSTSLYDNEQDDDGTR
jgi:hypothetical protein